MVDDLDVNPMSNRSSTDTDQPAMRAHPSYPEGAWTRVLEQQAGKVPSAAFLVAAGAAIAASAACELNGRDRLARFAGMWAPTLLIAGVYNKLVKTFGTT